MMKSRFVVSVLVAVLVLFATNSAMAISFSEPQLLDDWPETVVSGGFMSEVSGTQMQMSVAGTDTGITLGNRQADFTGSVGAMATYNVSSVAAVEGSDVIMGLSQFIGYTSTGNGIVAQIGLETWSGQNRIWYQVQEFDFSTQTFKERLGTGVLGDWSGGWKTNEDVTVAFARIGNQIYFYSPSKKIFTIIQPLDFADILSGPVRLWGWATANNTNSMTATISNVLIIYP